MAVTVFPIAVLLLLPLVCVIMIARATSQLEGFYIISANPSLINTYELSCHMSNGMVPAVTVFFRNGRIFADNVVGGTHTFVLTRGNEGNFSCGERTELGIRRGEANNEMLIPFPEPNDPTINPGQFSANTGDAAKINCSVVPGFFVARYSVTWKNASDMSQVFFQRSRFVQNRRLNDRYSLDSRTFALIIDSVKPSDGASPYVCDVSVLINSQDLPYTRSPLINQTLDVFEAPAFLLSPSPVTIAENTGKNATFLCKVRSSPGPSTITWFHNTDTRNGVISSLGRNDRYNVAPTRIETVGGFQMNSKLTVIGVSSSDTGMVTCRAVYDDLMDASPTEQTTTLTVLSAPTNLDDYHTDNGGILYEVSLNRALPIPIRVDLWYSDMTTLAQERSLLPEYFYNTTTLRIFRSRAPFQRFRVQVRILYGDEVAVGPFFNSSRILETQQKNDKFKVWYIGGGLAAFLIVIIFVLVIVIAVLATLLCNSQYIMSKACKHCSCKSSKGVACSNGVEGAGRSSGVEGDFGGRVVEDSGTAAKRSTAERILDFFRCCSWHKCGSEEVSESSARIFVSNLKKIIKFGLDDTTINKKIIKEGGRNKFWPLNDKIVLT